MRIGDLAARTGIPPRMLRYYEEQGLLLPTRAANGYREYAEADVDRARTVRSLVRSGLTTRLVAVVLSMEERPRDWTPTCSRLFADMLTEELAVVDERIRCLGLSRDSMRSYLERVTVVPDA